MHRLISTLKERDFAYQSSNTKLYRLSYKILYLYNCISNNIDMFKVSRPIIRKFADKFDATVHLATLDEKRSNIVYIDRIEPMNSQKPFVMSSRVGKKAPCYCTAAGKILLSQYSDDEIRDIMKGEEYKTYTDKTIKNIDEFFEKHGRQSILIARLLPFVSFDAVSYAAGLTSMSFVSFFIATGIGQTPATIVYSYVGGMLTGGARLVVTALLIIFALSILIVMIKQIYNERQKRNGKEK